MIDFNIPPFTGKEFEYMQDAVASHKICGDGAYTKKCQEWMNEHFGVPASYLTTSGTSALEMAALLCDIRPDTLNIDEKMIEAAITDKTKAICVVHYAGVSCEMEEIMKIARKYGLFVVEDAAQAVGSSYHGKPLGTIGDFGCFSFHETKNYSMGEGGAILLPDIAYRDQAEIYREKGTDRSRFFRGQVDKYTWRDYGSSYLPSDLNAAYLWAQLEAFDTVMTDRLTTWNAYYEAFRPLMEKGLLELPVIPEGCVHNAHMFYVKLHDMEERTAFLRHMKASGVLSVFHYIPLHSAPAGLKFGRFHGEDRFTTKESERLARLPLYYGLSEEDRSTVIRAVNDFFGQ